MLLHTNDGTCIPRCNDCKRTKLVQETIANGNNVQIINKLYCIYNCDYPTEPCDGFCCKNIQGIPYLVSYMKWKDVEDAEFKEIETPALESNQTEIQQNDKET